MSHIDKFVADNRDFYVPSIASLRAIKNSLNHLHPVVVDFVGVSTDYEGVAARPSSVYEAIERGCYLSWHSLI